MKVIKPRTYTPSMLVSTTATESASAWASGTTYAKDAEVHHAGFIYLSLQAANTGNTPATSPTWWVRTGPDNRSAMFDGQVSTATTQGTGPLTVVLDPGYCGAVGMVGLAGTSVDVTVTKGAAGPVVYEKSVSLDSSLVFDWYDYFFADFDLTGEVVLTDLPPYNDARLEVSINGTNVQVGAIVFGTLFDLGDAEHGATAGITDYSRKDTDEFGTTTFLQRAYAKRMSARMLIPNVQLRKVQRILGDLRATPSVWIGADDVSTFSPLVVFGWYRDFSIDIQYATHSYVSLEVEGLT
jgi:hypothetical protein